MAAVGEGHVTLITLIFSYFKMHSFDMHVETALLEPFAAIFAVNVTAIRCVGLFLMPYQVTLVREKCKVVKK